MLLKALAPHYEGKSNIEKELEKIN